MGTAKSAKTKQTNSTPKTFDPAAYLYGFTSGQRGTVEMAVKARNLKIQIVGKTDDGTAVIAVLEGRRKTVRYEYITAAGGYGTGHEKYDTIENAGAIEQSILSYAEYLEFIRWKYAIEITPGTEAAPPSQTELHRRAVKIAKYYEMIKSVIRGSDNVNRVQTELVTKFGDAWYDALERWSKTEFRDEVRNLWLGDCEGGEDILFEEYRTPPVAPDAPDSGHHESVFREVELSKVIVSTLQPQAKRRARFKDADISELAENIKNHGLINPITVRPVGGDYEIVAGERRFLATKKAGLDSIFVHVKNLTDETALEVQLFENLERQDVHPLDEAEWYRFLLSTTTSDVPSLALRLGTSVGYVTNRLKLNDLLPEIQTDIENDAVPLGHALEISKYPIEAQREIYEQYLYRDADDITEGVYPLSELRADIQRYVLLNLAQSPFSLKATNLRPDGLACVDCPQRTNFHPTLFGGDEETDAPDYCLNKLCFEGKTRRQIEIRRETISMSVRRETDDTEYTAPLISSKWYADSDDEFPEALGRSECEVLKDKKCGAAEQAVFADGQHIGETALICRDPNCPEHGARFRRNSSRSGTSVPVTKMAAEIEAEQNKEREQRLIRKEEIFDVAVGEKVRLRVLKRAAAKFDAGNTVFDHPQIELFKSRLLERLWTLQCSYSKHTAKIIRDLLGLDKTELGIGEWGDTAAELHAVSADQRARLFFLLLTAFAGELHEGGEWHSQADIRNLAEIFDTDYPKLDAEERLAKAPMKQKDVFRSHLHSIEAGERDAKIPRMHSDKWKPEDRK